MKVIKNFKFLLVSFFVILYLSLFFIFYLNFDNQIDQKVHEHIILSSTKKTFSGISISYLKDKAFQFILMFQLLLSIVIIMIYFFNKKYDNCKYEIIANNNKILMNIIGDNVDDIVIIYDYKKNIVRYISNNCYRIIGLEAKNLYKELNIIDVDGKNIFSSLTEKMIPNFEYEKEYTIFNQLTNLPINISLRIKTINYKKIVNKVIIIKDISLNQKNREILYQALCDSKIKSNLKSNYLSKVSHEIRTPLNGIIGMNSIALEKIDYKNKATIKEYLMKIDTSSKYLLSIINNVLDYSKIESGKMELQNQLFELTPFVHSIESVLMSQLQSKAINLNVNMINITDEYLYGDSLRLSQILMNLLSNSIKFSKNKGNINLSFEEISKSNNNIILKIIVSDYGIGMSEEFVSKLFLPFNQEKRGNDKVIGTGLGLSITKNLIDLMNGTINVNSILNKGTTFEVNIPFSINSEKKKNTSIDNEIIRKDLNVLLVEDNDLNIEICLNHLSKYDFKIDICQNGLEAYKTFKNKKKKYDIILMDVQMPIMDGYEATKKIRLIKTDYALNIPILAMTADVFDTDIKKAISAGMDGHVGKPIIRKELFNEINILTNKNKVIS